MLTDKKKLLFVIGISIILFLFYWFYLAKPNAIPSNDQLIEKMNKFPETSVNNIQDKILLDETHLFVPFISDSNDYGASFWVWQKHKWEVMSIDLKGRPSVWKINKKDFSTYFFVWNIHPEDRVQHLKFYLIKDRGYTMANGIEKYHPKIQMETTISMETTSYGINPLPTEWIHVMDSFTHIKSNKAIEFFINQLFPKHDLYFGWNSYDQFNKNSFPNHLFYGGGYSNGNYNNIDELYYLNESELEFKSSG
ncbi:hypothetical protein [Chengkuizengella marina]|uniref:Uncharacterized protein n=1 Tax=Chengkuizengella marina TaxID=2507566 RepID=A0A6N9Q2K0_9BACL|nr:hypothetical protein [Chengkuizengella marina]NBI29060.1 hypothetical protein [Chengkuizengella marina]